MSSRSLNKVMLIGNLTRDPEMRYTPQGTAVTTVGLATNRSWKTEGGEVREEVEFHRIVAWNKLAELCSQLLTKGRKVYVEGRLQTRTFTGSDNAQHTITEIVIEDMVLLDSKRPDTTSSSSSSSSGIGIVAEAVAVAEPVKPAAQAVADDSKTDDKKTKKTKEPEPEPDKSADRPAMNENVNVDDIPF